jgi:hypothetical protein
MRIKILIPFLTLLLAISIGNANAQCKAFAKRVVLPELGSYTHDGNYHAAILVEGEEAELYKTFYSDMDYRISIGGDEKIPAVEFVVLDTNRNLLYSNRDNNLAGTWDFKLESSQQLKIVVKVPPSNKAGEVPSNGCVAIMFGFRVRR